MDNNNMNNDPFASDPFGPAPSAPTPPSYQDMSAYQQSAYSQGQQPAYQQQAYQQQGYQQYPNYSQQNYGNNNYFSNTELEQPLSLGDWLLTIFLTCIPCVNIVMLFIWAFGNENKSKSNWAKANLIIIGIGVALYVLMWVIFGAAIIAAIH
ncbi:MAG: hypothetical protein IKI75_01970 [Lachnospiraceae bacterium]|nr:hypothetical protein [Lachnospiraceae bacterium]